MVKQIKKEPIYKSRRLWSAGLTLLATIGIIAAPEHYEIMRSIGLIVASSLGIGSWVFPKK